MGLIYDNWLWLWNRISPQVDSQQIDEILAEARQSLPTPVFWMLGKVQQGKTSIIRALSGRSDAEIGKGFRPCTRTSVVYAYPDEAGCFLKFLDTRGLGEVGYDPADDLKVFADQSHCVIVVVKAMDHAQQDVLWALRAIRKQRPQWPVIVCQTTLHEGYSGEAGHVVPYPYDQNPFPDAVSPQLARSLVAQRRWFQDERVRFAPLDFTYADHGQRVYEPADYGLDALWEAVEAALPFGLREMVRNNIEVRRRLHDTYFDTAHPHILVYAAAAGGAGAIPVPYIDVPVVLAIQAELFHAIGAIYSQPINAQQMATIASGLGIGYLARFGIRELAKLIPVPGVGSAISGAFAAASTYGLGIALCEYFGHVLDGNVPDAKMFRGWYREAFAAAKLRFPHPIAHRNGNIAMTAHTNAWWLFLGAVVLIITPYLAVFGIGGLWMWQHGWVWYWALGTGLPTLLGLMLAEWGRRLIFPRADTLPHPPPASTAAGRAAMQAVQEISQRWQAQDPPLDQPEALEKVVRDVLLEVLETVARQFRPQDDRPALQVPVAHIAALVELVARDFRRTFSEKVPWGNTVTLGRLLWWKEQGQLGWRFTTYVWQLNRIWRMLMRPATALVQEVQDHVGQNLATKSADGLKRWAIDYCVTRAGDYAIQLYSGGFVLDDEYRPRISAPVQGIPFEQEPLQILVVGQVKSGKSSLINALLGEMHAPVDALPATDQVAVYECQPDALPRIILRDTPGYGTVAEQRDPFSQLSREIEECDLLLMVCTASSAARQADRELLRKVHECYQRGLKRIMPPIVYVLTHIDMVPDHLVAEAAAAVASDLGLSAEQVAVVCAQWGRLANLEGVAAAIREKLPEAERLKCFRCIRQIREEQDENKILRQVLNGLRLTGGWIVSNT